MEIFTEGINIIKTFITITGGAVCAVGALSYFMAFKDDNAGSKHTAMLTIVSGGGIALIGMTLIPMLATAFG